MAVNIHTISGGNIMKKSKYLPGFVENFPLPASTPLSEKNNSTLDCSIPMQNVDDL